MSDFVPRDILPDLWEEILKRHWSFLETEENMQKLEERKKLEGCLKEFLSIVPHDRKFFLPETAHVLRKSIREMDDFTAYKAIIGFEAISQYANNLFTKPWRKEYRTLKKYSGFFVHEVKANLLDSEKLLEAIGYRHLTDEVLILDGPICPDQVTNVSRDAMAAYVECQIMKNVYAGLLEMGISCTWQDIYNFREKYAGGATHTIKGLLYARQDSRLDRDKIENRNKHLLPSPENPKSFISPNVPQCQNCAVYHHAQHHEPISIHSNTCALQQHRVQTSTIRNNRNGINNALMSSYPAGNYQPHTCVGGAAVTQPHMSHSRSLEHYRDPHTPLLHRHSFDHQQQGCTVHCYPQHLHQHVYESPYDCIDGASVGDGSSVSYTTIAAAAAAANANEPAYSHPYNVSGNRYPLPYNISNQINSHYATPTITCNGVKGNDIYNHVDNTYATVLKSHKCNYGIHEPPKHQNAIDKDYQTSLRHQYTFPPDHQLIDFNDRAPLAKHDFHAQMHSMSQIDAIDDEGDYYLEQQISQQQQQHQQQQRLSRHPINHINAHTTYTQPKDVLCQHSKTLAAMPLQADDDIHGSYVYARPVPRSSRGTRVPVNATEKYFKNSATVDICSDNNRNLHTELKSSHDVNIGEKNKRQQQLISQHECEISDASYDTTLDDFVTVGHSEHPQFLTNQATKNQDGVGSFESWDFVFQNLEKSGYSKDLGERGDLLVQSLNLDTLKLGNSNNATTEKKRTKEIETKEMRQTNENLRQMKNIEKSKQEKSILKQQNNNSLLSKKQPKSVLKSLNDNSRKTTATATTTITTTPNAINNGNVNNLTTRSGNKETAAAAADVRPIPTQVIITSPNEWSCRFCTFLNPDTKRICEMCCRSKDFNLETTVSKTPTCV